MCRHLAYLGTPVTLASLVLDPPHSLVVQAERPKMQIRGAANADGYGVGWYDPALPEPCFLGSVFPIWSDPTLPGVGRAVRSGTVLASVRSATEGGAPDGYSLQPYRCGRWLFLHNGSVVPFRDKLMRRLRRDLSDAAYARLRTSTDSETLFAVVLDLVDNLGPAGALRELVRRVEQVCAETGAWAALNLGLSDGERVVMTRHATPGVQQATLHLARGHARFKDGVLVASEPLDDDPTWTLLPESSMVELLPGGEVRVEPLGLC